MPRRVYLSKIVGSGTEDDPFRAKVADHGAAHGATIPSQADGTPASTWALLIAEATSLDSVDGDADNDGLPQTAADATLTGKERKDAQRVLDKWGAPVTVAQGDTLRSVVERTGRALDPDYQVVL